MKNSKKTFIQLIKFGIVGCINTLLSLAIYYAMVYFRIDYMASTIAGYFGSSILGYVMSKIWVFNARNVKVATSAVKYYIVYGASLLINLGCMYTWVHLLNISQYIAPILTLCITVPFNFIFNKLWVYRN